jgi:ribosomal peptide maturation radical SAM protein 1
MMMDVAFAVLPFADVDRPAIGVSLLKAEIGRLGFSASIQYFNLKLAEIIGQALYAQLSDALPSESLIGEWFFSDLLFGDQLPHEQDYIAKILSRHAPASLISDILQARQVRRDFVEQCARRLQTLHPRIVGFTTTFHQTCVCLAVARRLKQLPDAPIVIFGGANCEGEMGVQLLRSFPWIDYVCTREGDVAFPTFLQRLLRAGKPGPIPGILRQGESLELSTPDLIRDLNTLPMPDYQDYFEQLGASPLHAAIKPELLVETSRGCWWGAKHHCTFCGLNGDTMSFRSKSPERVFDELALLSSTYGVKRLNCVDNILDMKYLNTLFPKLQESGLDVELFYEVKANLRYDQVALLRAGGVWSIQPGIESFSNEVLRLMRKGCTGLQNIQLLRWCEEQGIIVAWNLLAGFPGELASEYARTAKLLPLLAHLQPPTSCAPIRLDRFSPLFTQAAQFGLRRIRPTSAYYYVYPLGRRELARLAYFFDFDYPDGRHPSDYLYETRREVQSWHQAWGVEPEKRPRLDAASTAHGGMLITDTRACATRPTHRLTGLAAAIYQACDTAQSAAGLRRRFNGGVEEEIRAVLTQLESDKLTVEMEGQYVSLAVMRNRAAGATQGGRHVDTHLQETTAAQSLLRAL